MGTIAIIRISKREIGGKSNDVAKQIIQRQMTAAVARVLKEHVRALPVYDFENDGKIHATMRSDAKGMTVRFGYEPGKNVSTEITEYLYSMTAHMFISIEIGGRRVENGRISCKIKIGDSHGKIPARYSHSKEEEMPLCRGRRSKYGICIEFLVEKIEREYRAMITFLLHALIGKASGNLK